MEWIQKLDIDRQGKIMNSIKNVYLILVNNPEIDIYYDFCEEKVLIKKVPWRKLEGSEWSREWTDMVLTGYNGRSIPFLSDTAELYFFFEGVYGITDHNKINAGFKIYLSRKDGDHD